MLEQFIFSRLLRRPCGVSDPVQRIAKISQDARIEIVRPHQLKQGT
jgi:hypothetical protein